MTVSYIAAGIAGALFIAGLLILLKAYRASKGVYDDYLSGLDDKEFKLKKYLGIGLYMSQRHALLSKLPDSIRQTAFRYDSSVRSRVGELYGAPYQDYYSQIHIASKWLVSLGGFTFCEFAGTLTSLQGDLSTGMMFIVIGIAAAAGLPFVMDRDLNSRIEKRHTQLRLEFPEFINELVLLVNAGMTIPRAWEKIADKSTGNTPLQRELQICMADIRAGKPMEVAFEEFGRRCRIKEIIKFVSVIILNLRKGGSELTITLQAQSSECWEMRKSAARRLGEEASSKMMLPMALMLLGIMMVVALPAVLSIMSM